MLCSRVALAVLTMLLVGSAVFAQGIGTPSLGWVTVGMSQAYDPGFVRVTVYNSGAYAFSVTYNDSVFDTVDSVVAGLKAGFDDPASPVTGSIANNVLVLTSKITGSAANSLSLSVDCSGYLFCASAVGMIGGRGGLRNFQMTLFYGTPATGDIAYNYVPFTTNDPPQPPGRSILGLGSWTDPNLAQLWSGLLSSGRIDLTRVDAIYVDEPYANYLQNQKLPTSGDPCADSRVNVIASAYNLLQTAASTIKQSSPRMRFWVNFSQPETDWLRSGSCASFKLTDGTTVSLNAPYIDVVSVDWYQVDFNTTVQPVYQWFSNHRSYPGEQLALVPGTFLQSSAFVDPVAQAVLLEEYFDYATKMNQSCTLPMGNNGATGVFDRCPVWMVIGWVYTNFPGGPSWHFIGMNDPQTAAIQAAWQAELSTPRLGPSWWPAIQQILGN